MEQPSTHTILLIVELIKCCRKDEFCLTKAKLTNFHTRIHKNNVLPPPSPQKLTFLKNTSYFSCKKYFFRILFLKLLIIFIFNNLFIVVKVEVV